MTKKNDDAVSPQELNNGLKLLEGLSRGPDRITQLFAKSQSGAITEGEREELMKAISGQNGNLAKSAAAGLQGNNQVQEAWDASDFLKAQGMETVNGLKVLADTIEKSLGDNQQFNHAAGLMLVGLAKGYGEVRSKVEEQNTLLKSIADKLGAIDREPASGPRGMQPGQKPGALNKGFQNGEGQPGGDNTGVLGTGLTKGQLLDGMGDMISKGINLTGNGERVDIATSKLEHTNQITPTMALAVAKHVRSQNAANAN